MNPQRRMWFVMLLVVMGGIAGLLPMWKGAAATIKLSGDLQVNESYLGNHERWFVFKALHPDSSTDYDLYTIDLTVTPYTYRRLDVPPLQANDDVRFSPSDRYLLINRSTSTFTWELYVHDFEANETYFVTYGQDRSSAQFTPNEQHLLLQPGYGKILYSLPITGGNAIRLTPLDFPVTDTIYLFWYQPSPDGSHVIMSADPLTDSRDGYVGYAPITETGTTIWRETAALVNIGGFSPDGNIVYFKIRSPHGTQKLMRLDLPDGTAISLMEAQEIYFRNGDNIYAFIVSRTDTGVSWIDRLKLDNGVLTPLFATAELVERTVVHEATRQMVIGTWTPDQNKVYGLNYETPTAAIPLITVSEPSLFFNKYAFTPDGNAIIIGEALDIEEVYLHRVAPDGSIPPLWLLEGTPVHDSFQPGKDSLAVWGAVNDGEQSRLQYIPLNGDPPITTFMPPPLETLTIRHVLNSNQVIVRVEDSGGTRSFYLTDLTPAASLYSNRTLLGEGMNTNLTVRFMPPPTDPATVTFAITGTADSNDILLNPDVLVIPPGTEAITTTLTVVEDGQQEAHETGTIFIIAEGGVILQSPISVTLTLQDEIYQIYTPLIRYFD